VLPGTAGAARHGSPAPGGSILITSAPKSERMVAAAGPAIQLAQSMTFRPAKIPSAIRRYPRDTAYPDDAATTSILQILSDMAAVQHYRQPIVHQSGHEECAH